MKLRVNDCLKYWRVIRYFVKRKHGLTTCDLEMLLFLYSEDSIYGVNADGFPYRKDTKTMVPPHKKTMSDSIVVKPKKKKRGA